MFTLRLTSDRERKLSARPGTVAFIRAQSSQPKQREFDSDNLANVSLRRTLPADASLSRPTNRPGATVAWRPAGYRFERRT